MQYMNTAFLLSLLLTTSVLAAPQTNLSEKAIVQVSSTCAYDCPETHLNLVRGEVVEAPFHTNAESNPWVVLKLPTAGEIKSVEVKNRPGQNHARAATLSLSLSDDGKTWISVWSAGGKSEKVWQIPLTDAAGKGKMGRYVRLQLKPEKGREFLHLSRVTVLGQI